MREQKQNGYLNTNESTIATELHGSAMPTIDSTMMSKFRDFIFPFLVLLSRTKVQYKVQCLNSFKPLPDKPIIFAANHSDFRDMPIILNVTKRHSYILSGIWEEELFKYTPKNVTPPQSVRASIDKVRIGRQNAYIMLPIIQRRAEDMRYDFKNFMQENWNKV